MLIKSKYKLNAPQIAILSSGKSASDSLIIFWTSYAVTAINNIITNIDMPNDKAELLNINTFNNDTIITAINPIKK